MPWHENGVPPDGTCWRCHGESPRGQMMCPACDKLAEEFRRAIPVIDRTRKVVAPPQCTCLSISRDPLCYYHGDRDKVDLE